MKGGRGGEPNLKSDPQSLLCVRGACQLGRFGAHALRQEQRGGCMGEGQWGDGKGDACLPAWLAFILTSMCINEQIVPVC